MREIREEITPVAKDDLFVVLDHVDAKFDYPIHCHSEYEINLVLDTEGYRVIGDCRDDFQGVDLILVAPYVPHVWKSERITNHVVTVQFPGDILEFPIMNKSQLRMIRELLSHATIARHFFVSRESRIVSQLLGLKDYQGFDSAIEFLRLLGMLSEAESEPIAEISGGLRQSKSRRINKVLDYTVENLQGRLRVGDMATMVNMSESAFSHFFKKHTGLTYVTYVNNLRIAKACRLLESTMMSVSEICYETGFNNKSNFNRIFLRARGVTPKEYRKYINNILV